jgi:glyoxylase-like metal-dependent hydrolase (beta-lactamase superfamily II)
MVMQTPAPKSLVPSRTDLNGSQPGATRAAYPNGNPAAGWNPPGVANTDSAVPLHRRAPVRHDYASTGPAPGNLALRWTYGSNVAAKNRDPRIQVMQYNEDTFILRQNVCVHWEAPFTYLLFGNDRALLIDTGATADARHYPLRETVDAIITRWCQARGRTRLPLTVVLTSGEDVAQNQGLVQFADRPLTTLQPKPLEVMKRFHKLTAWPSGTGRIDLGDRILEVIPTPGAHKDGISLFDPYSGFLFTGDLFYPGKIQIGNFKDFTASLDRLKRFRDAHQVKWLMGGHVEMMFVPGKAYPRFATYKPYERVLQMEPALLDDGLAAAAEVAGRPMMLIRPDFILYNDVSPDQRTRAWPEGVPNIEPPRPF